MKSRKVVITIEAETNIPLKDLKILYKDIPLGTPIQESIDISQVQVNSIQGKKAPDKGKKKQVLNYQWGRK